MDSVNAIRSHSQHLSTSFKRFNSADRMACSTSSESILKRASIICKALKMVSSAISKTPFPAVGKAIFLLLLRSSFGEEIMALEDVIPLFALLIIESFARAEASILSVEHILPTRAKIFLFLFTKSPLLCVRARMRILCEEID
ncbi:unnamed protein product [Phytomonas sp. Hart1]|nr:unnamed protein product [Phytomonas sp. Hart1]|eukprot:CCW69100.1 unnamed protein product [Phytomonas sp. isolate Hart1]